MLLACFNEFFRGFYFRLDLMLDVTPTDYKVNRTDEEENKDEFNP